ncbi:MAG: hypothetical protein ABIO19_09495, partial [Burkholderiaceae bacterium]
MKVFVTDGIDVALLPSANKFLISYQPQTKSGIHNIVIPAKAGNHTSHAESPVYGSPLSRGRR